MAKIKVRRTHREELPGVAVLRDSVASEIPALAGERRVLDLDMEVDPNLRHLIDHDPDGFFSAIDHDETLGFVAAHMRSRQWVLSELWVLPQHRGRGAGEALLNRVLTYGERSGAREYLAIVPGEGPVQGLLLQHSFAPLMPVYAIRLSGERSLGVAGALARLLPGQDTTEDLLARRGQADLDRIDRIARGLVREVDHVYWLKERRLNIACVRQGERVAAYAYGGADQIGPIAGTTQDAALAAIGWALDLARRRSRPDRVLRIHVPARFTVALEALLEAGGQVESTLYAYGRGVTASFDRYVPATSCVP